MTTTLVAFAHTALCRVAAWLLPWTTRSHQDSYRHGYHDGLRDALSRPEVQP